MTATNSSLKARKTSYIVLGAVAAVVLLFLHLDTALLAGLFSYMILDVSHKRLSENLSPLLARTASLGVFLVTAGIITWLLVHFVHLAIVRLPVIANSTLPKIDELLSQWGIDIGMANDQDFKAFLTNTLKENVQSVTKESGLLTRGFFQILGSVLITILCFFTGPAAKEPPSLYATLSREVSARLALFMLSFERVSGAQVLVSTVNTCLTAAFLLWLGFPYVHFLVLATFIIGMIPIFGNVVTNTMIIGTALTISPHLALITLVYLIAIHQLHYLVTGKIIGRRMQLPVWQILLGILVGESLLGTTGMILAPAVVHYVREEMRSFPSLEG